MVWLVATVNPTTLVSNAVSWFLGIAGTILLAFLAFHAIKHLLVDRERGIMPLLELAVIGIVAAIFIFDPHAFQGLAQGFVQLLGLPS